MTKKRKTPTHQRFVGSRWSQIGHVYYRLSDERNISVESILSRNGPHFEEARLVQVAENGWMKFKWIDGGDYFNDRNGCNWCFRKVDALVKLLRHHMTKLRVYEDGRPIEDPKTQEQSLRAAHRLCRLIQQATDAELGEAQWNKAGGSP